MQPRPSWDVYFIHLATIVASRGTCRRKKVGAVLTKDRRVVSTGYVGSIRGQQHCTDECGCEIPEGQTGCIRTVHAESNAIAQAAANGVSTQGATLYCTMLPCVGCFKLIANSGIVRIVYDETYRIDTTIQMAATCGVEIERVHVDQLTIRAMDLVELLDERDRLRKQVLELQMASNEALLEKRAKALLACGI